MDDEELAAQLTHLDRPAAPPEEFADDLYATLVEYIEGTGPDAGDTAGVAPLPGITDRTGPASKRRAPGLVAAAVAFVVVAAAGALAAWLARDSGPSDAPPAAEVEVTAPQAAIVGDAPTTAVEIAPDGTIILSGGMYPTTLAVDGTTLWVLGDLEPVAPGAPPAGRGVLIAVDRDTGTVRHAIELGDGPAQVAVGFGSVWVTHWASGALTRIDPVAGEIRAIIQLELPYEVGTGPDARLFIPNDVVVGHGAVWVSTARGAVARVDPSSNDVAAVVERTPRRVSEMAIGPDAVWMAEGVHGLSRIDPVTSDVTTIPLEVLDHAAGRVAAHGDGVWVAGDRLARNPDGSFAMEAGGFVSGDESGLSRIEADSDAVVFATSLPGQVAVIGATGDDFVAVDPQGSVWTIDARDGAVIAPVPGPLAPGETLLIEGTRLWIVGYESGIIRSGG